MKFLIVEDELLIQKSLKKILERKGMEVEATSHGIEAIDLILNNTYDKIICDLMLQDITGFDILEASKKKYTLDEISSLFTIITAYSSESVQSKAKEYNCRIINKPFNDINHIIDTIIAS